MNRMCPRLVAVLIVATLVAVAPRAMAQNPVQWSGSVKQSVDRAAEQSLPLLIWVKDGGDLGEDDDLEDAQEDCFRDPMVVGIIQKRFVPLRVNRNSRVIEEAGKLGLPTGYGLYCAVVTSSGTLLEQMGPGEVAQPPVFAARLTSAYGKFCDELYQKELRPLLEDHAAPKAKVRRAAQTVWRLGITKADTALIALLDRKDLQPPEVARLYELLAALGTQASIGALLERSAEKPAAVALAKAEPGALEWILPAMPSEDATPTPKQLAAYAAAARVARTTAKDSVWWETAKHEARRNELDRVEAKAATVLEYWQSHATP